MKAKWFLGCVFSLAALAAPAVAQISVYIGTPPPPIRYEVRPPMPQVGYVWIQGYWAPAGHRYVWRPGHWARPPYYGAAWRPGRWSHEGGGWRYNEGGWGPRDWRGAPREFHEDHRDWHEGPGHGHGNAYGHYK